jgi:hypothetical protein
VRYGKCFYLNYEYNPEQFLQEIEIFKNDWKQYNPRKDIPREGLSITSLDGELSGVPDLDSFYEYNKEHGTRLTELDIVTPTPVYQYALPYFAPFKEHVCRAHVIRLAPGGYFPAHRDTQGLDTRAFRIFVPLKNCNPDNMYFILEENILHFVHGRPYFVDTCVRHSLFNLGPDYSYFIVLNIRVNLESIRTLINTMW